MRYEFRMIMHNIFAMENKWKHLEMLLSDVCKMYKIYLI